MSLASVKVVGKLAVSGASYDQATRAAALGYKNKLSAADQVLFQARSRASELERGSARLRGEQSAAFASSGVRQEGSVKSTLLETMLNRAEQQRLIFSEARREAKRIRHLARRARKNEKRTALVELAGNVLDSLSSE